jgi:hypothetical protein
MVRYIVKRYDLLGDPPTKRVVGFTVKNEENGREEYIESVFQLSEITSSAEFDVCAYAYAKIEDDIKKVVSELSGSSIIGNDFMP